MYYALQIFFMHVRDLKVYKKCIVSEMFDKQQANSIFWSPQGQFLVLAGLRRSVLIKCAVFVCTFVLSGSFI